MTRLGEWRNSDIESYQSAYVSLVLHRFHIDQWSFSCSILCQLTALLCQDILANCATSPAVLVSIHINCCYIRTALVLSGAKSSTFREGDKCQFFVTFGGQMSIQVLKSKAIFFSDLSTLQWLILAGFKTFQLAPYCLGPKETLDEFSEDPDRLLLSSIAEKVPLLLLPTNLEDLYLIWLLLEGDGCKAGDHCPLWLRPGLNKPDSKAGWLHSEDLARLPIHNTEVNSRCLKLF